MKLQILILTQPSRRFFLEQLLAMLIPQGADVCVQQLDERLSLGENRQALIESATADYICHFDDDDLPATDYVETILPLLDGIDYVGFKVRGYEDYVPMPMTYHSLGYDGWWNDSHGYYRDISHLNPMRRTLALQQKMSGGVGEDCRWAAAMRGKVKTEHFVDRVLYHYLMRSRKDDAVDFNDPRRLALIAELGYDIN
jgi:hypothetical protein